MNTGWRYIGSFVTSSILVAVLLLGINIYTRQTQQDAESWVDHTHQVIDTIEAYTLWFERALSAQRGAIISRDNERFIESYQKSKDNLYSTLMKLGTIVNDNSEQAEEVTALQEYSIKYFNLLDYRLHAKNEIDLSDDNVIRDLRLKVREQAHRITQSEKRLLHDRMKALKATEQQNQTIVLLGSLTSFIFFMLVNILAYKSVMQTVEIKRDIQLLNERYNLAIQGTTDGLFDWDIEKNSVWYSPRLLEMQGYMPSEVEGDFEFFETHLHPDDRDSILEQVNSYLKGEIQTYSAIFRFRHKDGHYLWIQSRGKVLHNSALKPVRMVGAHTDISPLKSIEAQLVFEKEQALKANVAKTDFLAHISHEIRTPLNVIINVSKILSNNHVVEGENAILLDSLRDSSFTLQDLINDFLDVSKIESGELTPEKRSFHLERVLNQVSNIMTVKAHEKGLAFNFKFVNQSKYSRIMSDRLRLRQILINLVNNAIKFTPKGSVTLDASMDEDALRIQVIDTGIGIPDEFKDKIFDKFTQADASVARLYGGSGLGLNISARLAELLGGKLTVDSVVGEGSTFTFSIPTYQLFVTQADGNLGSDAGGDRATDAEIERVDDGDDDAAHADGDVAVAPVPDRRVLVAEDYDGNILILRYFLNNLGVTFTLARDGDSALAEYKAGTYDLVLMDIQMPGMDGIEATRCIRLLESDSGCKRVPIIAMTAHALSGDEQRCREAGMTDYLTKPLQEEDLMQVLLKYGILQYRVAPSSVVNDSMRSQ